MTDWPMPTPPPFPADDEWQSYDEWEARAVGDVEFTRDVDGRLIASCPNDGKLHYGIVPDTGNLAIIPPPQPEDTE